jgi:hypothetical protein
MTNRSRIHVTKDEKGWKAQREGASRASVRGETQAVVDRRAREILRGTGGGEVLTHGRDGRIRSADTIPPARDPNPPRDKEH